jgi:hypothetical protein
MSRLFTFVSVAATALAVTLIPARGWAQQTASPPTTGDDGANTLVEHDAQGELTTRENSAGFGQKRQWVFSSDASIQVQRTTQSDTDGALTSLSLAPAADYFVMPNLSVGGSMGVYYTKTGERNGSRFTIGPRVGYNLPISRLLSVWPKLGINYAHTGGDTPVAGTTANNNNDAIALSLFAPVMLHPAPHFFAGLGPFLETDLSGDNRATSWGIKLTLGGWL